VALEVARAFDAAGIDLAALGVAWAGALPIVFLVPAFGLKALPGSARAVIALALGASIAPSVALGASNDVALVEMVTRGFAIAVAAAVPLWAATMAGGVMDALRGTREPAGVPVVEGRPTPLGVPLSLLASSIFLTQGGASRAASALVQGAASVNPIAQAAHDLTAGISLAVALGAPILTASVVVEVGAALVARAVLPAHVHGLLAPLRALAVLLVLAVSVDRIAEGIAIAVRR
jgi:type III secretory pathway component EscT